MEESPIISTPQNMSQAEFSRAGSLKVFLLGGFRVQVDERLLEAGAFRLRKGRSLIKLLSLERHQRLHSEQVAEALWFEAQPEAAMNSLYQVLHATRRVLSGESRQCPFLRFEDEMLVLSEESHAWVDVSAFENAVRQAQWTGTSEALEQALALYTGELLPEDRYEEWAETHRQRLHDYFLLVLSKLGQYHAAHQDFQRAAGVYERLVQADPLNEESVVGWMRSLAEQGMRRQAQQLYQELAVRLKRELGVEPAPTTQRAYEQILQVKEKATLDQWVVSKRKQHNLPQRLSSFVGRVQELEQVKTLLRQQRLLTLVGAGGVGKSRLGLEAAWEVLEDYPDGIWMAELAVISDGKLLGQTIEAALGVQFAPGQPIEQALENYLYDKYLLLVLDNCEHILDACADLAKRLLENCPDLRLLATSRTPLGLEGERTWLVPPLSLPDPERLPGLEDLQAFDAVRLFAERAATANSGFVVTEQNGALVAQVCQKLDGIPLAIELAAARAGLLEIEQINERLARGLDLLQKNSPGRLMRHQTMRLCLDLSHAMLSAGEQILLRRLTVFAGGFTLPAAERVCGFCGIGEREVLDLLEGLVNRSMVVVEDQAGHAVRFRLLEPVRQYGEEKLVAEGETEELRDRHLQYCLVYAIEGEQYLRGPEQVIWQKRLMLEIHNFRAALGWALEKDVYSGLHLTLVLGWVWYVNNIIIEGARWLNQLMIREEGLGKARGRSPDQVWLHLSGLFATGQMDSAIKLLTGELEAQVTPQVINSISLEWVWWKNVQYYEDYQEVLRLINLNQIQIEALLETVRSLAQNFSAHGKRILAVALNTWVLFLGPSAKRLDEVDYHYAQARNLFHLALEISQQTGNAFCISETWGTGIGNVNLCFNYEQAVSDYHKALLWKEKAGDLEGMANIKDRLATALNGLGNFSGANRLLDEALEAYNKTGGYARWKLALNTKGTITWCLGDEARAEKLYRLAQEHSRDKDFDYHLAGYYLGCMDYLHQNYAEAECHMQEFEGFFRQREGKVFWADHYLAIALFGLGEMALHRGDLEYAFQYLEDALAHHLLNPYPLLHAVIHFSLGKIARRLGELDAARRHYQDALPHWGPLLGNPGLVYTLQALADLETARGQHEVAGRLLGSAAALQPRLRNPYFFLYIIRLSLEPVDAAAVEAATRQALGDKAFTAAFHAGAALTVEQAYSLALETCGE